MNDFYKRAVEKYGKKAVLITLGLATVLVLGLAISFGVDQPLENTLNG